MNEPSVLLVAERLSAGWRTPLLRDVALELQRGQGWFVLGCNGSGKTTLLATLLGLLRPLGGSVRLGRDVEDRQRLGYVPQEQKFEPALPCTVAEFVEIGLSQRDGRVTGRENVRRALMTMQIDALARQQVRELSLGQRRRVLVARALARAPLLLLLDEPTANLDAYGAALLAADLERLRQDGGLCVVHVSHDFALAKGFATHIALVDRGAVIAGPAASLLADDRLRAALEASS